MAITVAQEAAFTGATQGVAMGSFELTILLVFYSVLYIWAAWVVMTQWRAWCNRKINFYDFLIRTIRSIFLTLVLGFLL